MLHITPFFTAYSMVLAFVFGTVFASFLTCMGWRMCKGESVLKGRSHCDSCGHVLESRDLIPIFSFILNKGRCRHCGAEISKMNLYGELGMGILFAMFTYFIGNPIPLAVTLFFICILYLVTVTDLIDQMIPDGALLAAILVRVAYYVYCYFNGHNGNVIYVPGHEPPIWRDLIWLLVDGLAVSLPLLILVLIMEKILKKEAMGGGDIKLLFVTGLYVGWMKNILVVFIACIVGIIMGMIQMRGQEDTDAIPTSEDDLKTAESKDDAETDFSSETDGGFYFAFGPAIAVSTIFVMIFGNLILDWYLSLF